jgi:S-adenosylmethionine synthetase
MFFNILCKAIKNNIIKKVKNIRDFVVFIKFLIGDKITKIRPKTLLIKNLG